MSNTREFWIQVLKPSLPSYLRAYKGEHGFSDDLWEEFKVGNYVCVRGELDSADRAYELVYKGQVFAAMHHEIREVSPLEVLAAEAE